MSDIINNIFNGTFYLIYHVIIYFLCFNNYWYHFVLQDIKVLSESKKYLGVNRPDQLNYFQASLKFTVHVQYVRTRKK